MLQYRDMVAPYVCDVSKYLYDAIKEGKNILLEGQLGSLKDPDHGIYPMVTASSSTLAAYGPSAQESRLMANKEYHYRCEGIFQCGWSRCICLRMLR